MTPVTVDDLVLDRAAWERELDARRAEFVAYRRARRVELGELITLDFEDRTTVAWQVNRMLGIESIADADRIAEELAIYNRLLPGPRELSATMLIGIDDATELRRWKPLLIGIGAAVHVEVDGERATTVPDVEGHTRTGEPPMVQYLRLSLIHI